MATIKDLGASIRQFLMENRQLQAAILLLIVMGAIFFLPIVGILQGLEYESLYLRQLNVRRDHTRAEPVVIALDDATMASKDFESLFGRYPYPRQSFAYVVDFLARAKSKPRSVAFDIAYQLGKNKLSPWGDLVFAESIKRSGLYIISVIGNPKPEQWSKPGNSRVVSADVLEKNQLKLNGEAGLIAAERIPYFFQPYEELLTSGMRFTPGTGIQVNTLTQKVDHYNPFIVTRAEGKEYVLPHIALAAVMGPDWTLTVEDGPSITGTFGRVDYHQLDRLWIWWNGKANAASNFKSTQFIRGNELAIMPQGQKKAESLRDEVSAVYQVYSMRDVVFSELYWKCQQDRYAVPEEAQLCREFKTVNYINPIDPNVFSDRIVLVGMTSTNLGVGDYHDTIYESNYPGVMIVANVIDNLNQNEFLVIPQPGWLITLGLVALMGLFGVYAAARFKVSLWGVLLVFTASMFYGMLTLWVLTHHRVWLPLILPELALMSSYLLCFAVLYWVEARRKKQLRYTFEKYVSRPVMEYLEKNPKAIQLGGRKQELTMLFCDIRGFTTFSEENSSDSVQTILTRYFTIMNHIIMNRYRGTLNKLIGDAIMAYWGFPLAEGNEPLKAVSAALHMKFAMEEWRRDPNNPPFYIGIGIHTGEVTIGNVGSEDFMDLTVIGDNVNLAARLEGLNKEYQSTIIISKVTYELVKDKIQARSLGEVTVKGKSKAVEIFEVLDFKSAPQSTPELVAP